MVMVSQDRWSLVTGSVTIKCRTCQENMVFQDKWSFMAYFAAENIDNNFID